MCHLTMPGFHAAARIAAVIALLAVLPDGAVASAALDEEFRRGEKAYHTGDVIGAMGALRKAADQGHAGAQALLAELLDRAEFNEEAVSYYRKAAEQGNASGEYGLGTMYQAGEGVKRDAQQAMFWFLRAAEKNHPEAVKSVAHAYLTGDPGLDEKRRDNIQAVAWIRRAADLGYLPAIESLARAYKQGELGLSPDPSEAARWSARAQEIRKISGDRKGRKR